MLETLFGIGVVAALKYFGGGSYGPQQVAKIAQEVAKQAAKAAKR